MDIGFSGFRKVIELGMMSRWPIHRSDGGAYGTRTRSPVFAPNPRCAVSSVIRRRASSRLPGAQTNSDIGGIRASFLTSLKRGCLIFGQESHGRHEQGSD